jgi:hypothetical protein
MRSALYIVRYTQENQYGVYHETSIVIAKDDEDCFNLLKIHHKLNPDKSCDDEDFADELKLSIQHGIRFELAHKQKSNVIRIFS